MQTKSRIPNTILARGKRLVCRIYDNGGESFDRYTIAFKGYYVERHGMIYPYLAASDDPFHPQGFGQHGESNMFMKGHRLGKRVRFESLPLPVQKFILQSI
jgi:hypothetical protein